MIKPLPCPFCGGIPDVEPTNPKEDGNCWGEVLCRNDDCPAHPWVMDDIIINDDRGSDKYKEDAIKRWNIRSQQ